MKAGAKVILYIFSFKLYFFQSEIVRKHKNYLCFAKNEKNSSSLVQVQKVISRLG